MKKKFLAVVITSAMVAGALPGVATAAEDNSGIQTVQNTEDIQEDTLVLTIDESQKEKILSEYGPSDNVFTLNEFIGDDTEIPDPYGKPLTAYGECLEVLDKLIKKLADKLNSFMEEIKWQEEQ